MLKTQFTQKWFINKNKGYTLQDFDEINKDLSALIDTYSYPPDPSQCYPIGPSQCETQTPILHAFGKSEKRFYAACMAMQGILANVTGIYVKDVVELSYRLADALIEEESKTLKNE